MTFDMADQADDVRLGGDVTSDRTDDSVVCPWCGKQVPYEDRIDAIKNDILRKLRMLRPPNVTGSVHLPDIPSLHHLVDNANHNAIRTLPQLAHNSIDDDYEDHMTNMTVLVLSQPGSTTRFCSLLLSPRSDDTL